MTGEGAASVLMGHQDYAAQVFRVITNWVACQRAYATYQAEEPHQAPWWQPTRRRRTQENWAALGAERLKALTAAAQTAYPLLPEAADILRDEATHAERKGGRHVFHPEVLDPQVLPALAAAISNRALDHQIGVLPRIVQDILTDGALTARQVPELADLLTPQAVETYIRDQAAHYAAIANHPDIKIIDKGCDGDPGAIFEHVASGIAVQVWLPSQRPGFGSVAAGRHKVFPGEWPCDQYYGLGIGKRLYLAAADRFKNIRWQSQETNEHSGGVRRALHALDPWRWQSQSCTLCRGERGWRDRQQPGDFADH